MLVEIQSVKNTLWAVSLSDYMSPEIVKSLATTYLPCDHHRHSQTKLTFIRYIEKVFESILKLWEGTKIINMYF